MLMKKKLTLITLMKKLLMLIMLMKKGTNGNSANNNGTNTIKKSLITIRLKRPYVIY